MFFSTVPSWKNKVENLPWAEEKKVLRWVLGVEKNHKVLCFYHLEGLLDCSRSILFWVSILALSFTGKLHWICKPRHSCTRYLWFFSLGQCYKLACFQCFLLNHHYTFNSLVWGIKSKMEEINVTEVQSSLYRKQLEWEAN